MDPSQSGPQPQHRDLPARRCGGDPAGRHRSRTHHSRSRPALGRLPGAPSTRTTCHTRSVASTVCSCAAAPPSPASRQLLQRRQAAPDQIMRGAACRHSTAKCAARSGLTACMRAGAPLAGQQSLSQRRAAVLAPRAWQAQTFYAFRASGIPLRVFLQALPGSHISCQQACHGAAGGAEHRDLQGRLGAPVLAGQALLPRCVRLLPWSSLCINEDVSRGADAAARAHTGSPQLRCSGCRARAKEHAAAGAPAGAQTACACPCRPCSVPQAGLATGRGCAAALGRLSCLPAPVRARQSQQDLQPGPAAAPARP